MIMIMLIVVYHDHVYIHVVLIASIIRGDDGDDYNSDD